MERVRYMISDASNRIQVEAHVLRYWEEELELDVPRNEMGHRYYTEENIRQFEQIKKLKAEGFQLKAIKMLIHNPVPVSDETEEAGEETENIYDLAGVLREKSDIQQENKEQRIIKLSNDMSDAEQGNIKSELAVSDADAGSLSAAREEPPSKLEQFRMMMNEIVRSAIAENNRELGQEIGNQVEEKVLKELNYLMRDQEERDEERFRRLDEAIRSRQRRPPKEKRKFFHSPIHKVEEIG
ncbi:MAG: MerR family transcriptional regulator [Clostridiales bacterium]|nr:MerR family transcriptional regulator [Clostridiales bacterium]